MQKQNKVQFFKLLKCAVKTVFYSPKLYILTIALMIFLSLFTLYQPLLLGRIIERIKFISDNNKADDIASQSKGFIDKIASFIFPEDFKNLAALFLIIVILSVIFHFISKFIREYTDSKILLKLKHRLHDIILRLDTSYHKLNPLGKTMAVVQQFAVGANITFVELFRATLVQIITFSFSFFLILSQLNRLNINLIWKIILLILLITLPLLHLWFAKKIRKTSESLRDGYIEVQNEFINSASNPVEVQIMLANQQRSRSFFNSLVKYFKSQTRSIFFSSMNSAAESASVPVIQALFIISLVFNIKNNSLSLIAGSIVAFILIIPQVISPVQGILGLVMMISVNWPQVNEVIDILDKECPADKDGGLRSVINAEVKSGITLSNLSFSYADNSKLIYDNVTYTFQSGKKTGIAAKLGMGKSTLFQLLMKVHNIRSGKILINDRDIESFDINELRTLIVRVSQFPLFINGTVRANFKLASESVSDDGILEACRKTGFLDAVLIKKYEGSGLKSCLDLAFTREAGGDWTGGERRVFALTRALLLKPAILLIDEPTSGVDAIKSREIADLLKKDVFKDITMIIVDHNPKFLEEVCDEIICLDNASFVDRGSPEELIRRKSFFKLLYDSFDR